MNRLSNGSFRIAVFALLFATGAFVVNAQDKTVKVLGLEVDGRPVKAKLKVRIVLETKVLKARSDETGFVLPAEAVGKNVGVMMEFDRFKPTFFFVSPENFDGEWFIGVDTEPFAPEYLANADPTKTAIIYYVRFPNEADGKRRLVTVIGKPTVTITRTKIR